MPIQNTGVAEPIHHGNSYVLIYCFIFQKEGPRYTKILIEGFPDRSVGKEYACNAEDPSSIPGSSGEVDRLPTLVFLGFPYRSAGKESACNVGDLGSIPGLGRSPGEGNLPRPGREPVSPALAGRFFTTEPPGKPPK